MPKGINKAIVLGHLGNDPEVKQTSGGPMSKFSIATTESWKDKTTGEKKEDTQWHNIVCFGYTADFVSKYLHKTKTKII